jgi:hypothetical protein
MTQDEIIEMAKQVCDIDTDKRGRNTFLFDEYRLEAFAKLVAQRTKKRIFKRAEIAAELAIEHAIKLERDACANVAEQVGQHKNQHGIAAAIRARGQA